jgi:hypothetical protein
MALLLTSSPHSHSRSTSWSLLTSRPGALQQHLQQAQLARRQLDHLVVQVGHAAGGVEGQRAVLDARSRPCPGRAA